MSITIVGAVKTFHMCMSHIVHHEFATLELSGELIVRHMNTGHIALRRAYVVFFPEKHVILLLACPATVDNGMDVGWRQRVWL